MNVRLGHGPEVAVSLVNGRFLWNLARGGKRTSKLMACKAGRGTNRTLTVMLLTSEMVQSGFLPKEEGQYILGPDINKRRH